MFFNLFFSKEKEAQQQEVNEAIHEIEMTTTSTTAKFVKHGEEVIGR